MSEINHALLESHDFHSAFVAFIGRPNSGKSTLLNAILEENLSIVTSLPQTTRRSLKGIYTTDSFQIVFVDTPGIHAGKHALNKAISEHGVKLLARRDVDIVCYIVDLAREFGEEEDGIASLIQKAELPVCVVFNKKDLCKNPQAKIGVFHDRYPNLQPDQEVCLSAANENARSQFLAAIKPMLPSGPRYFPSDDLTDADLRFFAAEYIRAAIIESARAEVPHAAFVEILDYAEKPESHTIDAAIHVETQGQKGIIIGKSGRMIRSIQSKAADALANLTGVPAKIVCHVKVTPKWRDNQRFLSEMGLKPEA